MPEEGNPAGQVEPKPAQIPFPTKITINYETAARRQIFNAGKWDTVDYIKIRMARCKSEGEEALCWEARPRAVEQRASEHQRHL